MKSFLQLSVHSIVQYGQYGKECIVKIVDFFKCVSNKDKMAECITRWMDWEVENTSLSQTLGKMKMYLECSVYMEKCTEDAVYEQIVLPMMKRSMYTGKKMEVVKKQYEDAVKEYEGKLDTQKMAKIEYRKVLAEMEYKVCGFNESLYKVSISRRIMDSWKLDGKWKGSSVWRARRNRTF